MPEVFLLRGGFWCYATPLIDHSHPYQVVKYFRRVDEMRNVGWLLDWWRVTD